MYSTLDIPLSQALLLTSVDNLRAKYIARYIARKAAKYMDWKDFSFDYRLDTTQLIGHIIKIEAYKEAALNLVLPPEWRDQLDRLNRVRAVYGTTALEGNPLSEAEVSHQLDLLFDQPDDKKVRVTKEQLQIRNAGGAQAWVRMRFAPEHAPISLNDILRMHKMVTDESDTKNNIPGALRTFSVIVGSPEMGGVHKGAPHESLPEMMNQYIEFINSRRAMDQHPVIHALLAHFFLVTIHPFGDGNGRVSRLVEAGILFQHGYNVHGFYGLSNYFYRNEGKYKTYLQESRKAQPFDITPFINFAVEGFAEELKGINSFIKTKLNRIVYRNTLVRAFNKRAGERRRVLNQREYNLLDFLIAQTEPIDPFSPNPSRKIKLSELIENKFIQATYKDFTPRTFFRELSRLADMGFISLARSDGDKPEPTLELNFDAIGKY